MASGAAGRRFRPTFGFARKPETLDGQRVDVVRMKLNDATPPPPRRCVSSSARTGTAWARPPGETGRRPAGLGRRAVAGDPEGPRRGARGLAAAEALVPSAGSRDPARKAEVYLSIELRSPSSAETAGRAKAPARQRPLSALALTVDPEYLRLDGWIPPADMKALREGGVGR